MIPFVIALILSSTAVIWWIYHNEIANEFSKIYNSNTSDDDISKIEREYWIDLDDNNKNINSYNKSWDLWSSIYKLNENWKYLLTVWSRLNKDMYVSLKNFKNLWDSLTKKNLDKLNGLLMKYKLNLNLQEEFMTSEIKKRDCINNNLNNKFSVNGIEKAAAEKAAAEKAGAEKAAAEKAAVEKAAAEKAAAENDELQEDENVETETSNNWF